MNAIIVTGGTVEEFAALVVGLQERHGIQVKDLLETMGKAVDSAIHGIVEEA